TPNINKLGTRYYFVIINNGTNSSCNTVTSMSVPVKVFSRPVISAQPQAATYCNGSIAKQLRVSVVRNAGIVIRYQWYANQSNDTINGIAINGATDSLFTPSTINNGASPMITYYYCIVRNDGPDGANRAISNTASIFVDNLSTFQISYEANQTQILCLNGTVAPITLSVRSNTPAALSGVQYRWFRSNNNATTGGTQFTVNTQTGSLRTLYTPPSLTSGTVYYYVVASTNFATQTICNTITSAVSSTIIYAPPNLTKNLRDTNYCEGDRIAPLTISYQRIAGSKVGINWFRSPNRSIIGATSLNITDTFYQPLTIIDSVIYYAVLYDSSSIVGCNTTYTNFASLVINSKPTLTNAQTIICSGVPLNINLNPSIPGTSVFWSRGVQGGVTNDTAFGYSIINETLVTSPGVSAPVPVLYRVNLTNPRGCVNYDYPFVVTVNPTPQIAAGYPIQRTYCTRTNNVATVTETININSTVSGAFINWTHNNPNIGLNISSGINVIPSFTVNSALTTVAYDTISALPVLLASNGVTCQGDRRNVVYFAITPTPGQNYINTQLVSKAPNSVCYNYRPSFIIKYGDPRNYIPGTKYIWERVSAMSPSGSVFQRIDSTMTDPNPSQDTIFNAPAQTDSLVYYRVRVQFSGGCSVSSDTNKIFTVPAPVIRIDPDRQVTNVLPNSSINLTATVIDTTGQYNNSSLIYVWSDSLGFVDQNTNKARSYSVYNISTSNLWTVAAVSRVNGCETNASIRITLNDSLLIPIISKNAVLTPKGSPGINDVFGIDNYNYYANRGLKFGFMLYDRFGKALVTQTDNFTTWDGKAGEGSTRDYVNSGVYYYIITVLQTDNAGVQTIIATYRGTITLVL
ncbi:MAG: gliding motility-associated C-terminal domain-containing protein, partial [Sediminibacterium sp.]|nr:gliding motility-associated C-terminal domain-containing protein [Sediminibacterium sp.]